MTPFLFRISILVYNERRNRDEIIKDMFGYYSVCISLRECTFDYISINSSNASDEGLSKGECKQDIRQNKTDN